ncbi:MAG TPA: beta-galactosidase, partial [Ruminococcaceae bacterium]|nr:beta-galactosidase [Oscillospiraceae bacterium]
MGLGDGVRWQQHLADEIRKYDTTRPVTNAVCGLWMINYGHQDEETRKTFMKQFPVNDFWSEPDAWEKVTEKFMEPLDIVGYNYMCHCYDRDRELYPNRVVWGSET